MLEGANWRVTDPREISCHGSNVGTKRLAHRRALAVKMTQNGQAHLFPSISGRLASRCRKGSRLRVRPTIFEPRVLRAGKQFAWFKEIVDLLESFWPAESGAFPDMVGSEIGRVIESSGSDHLGQRQNGRPMKRCDPGCLFRDNERALPDGVLRRNPCWTLVRVAAERLDTAEREHEAARRVAPVSAQSQGPGHLEAGNKFCRSRRA